MGPGVWKVERHGGFLWLASRLARGPWWLRCYPRRSPSRGRSTCVGCPGARRVESVGCGDQPRLEAPDAGIGLLRPGGQHFDTSPGTAVSRGSVARQCARCGAVLDAEGGGRPKYVEDDGLGGAQHRGEQRGQVDVALACGAYDAGEDLLGVGALPGAVAAAHLADDDGGPDGLFGAPVGGVDRRVPQECEDGAEFDGQVRGEALGVVVRRRVVDQPADVPIVSSTKLLAGEPAETERMNCTTSPGSSTEPRRRELAVCPYPAQMVS